MLLKLFKASSLINAGENSKPIKAMAIKPENKTSTIIVLSPDT
jgi:hypothetical protein